MWSYALHGSAWLVLYLLFILAPLFAMLVGTLPPGARCLDRVRGGAGRQPDGDDGPAVRPDGAHSLRDKALERGRHLPPPTASTMWLAVGGGIVRMIGWGFHLLDPRKRALWVGLVIMRASASRPGSSAG